MDFSDKAGYKPNVKVEYVDDNGRMMSPKEAFRYLSHRFHGKGSGKRKTEKRSRKVEMEQVEWGLSFKCYRWVITSVHVRFGVTILVIVPTCVIVLTVTLRLSKLSRLLLHIRAIQRRNAL